MHYYGVVCFRICPNDRKAQENNSKVFLSVVKETINFPTKNADTHKKIQGVKTSMEKNRIRPIKVGNSVRMSFSRQKEVLEMPNLIEVQTDSYKWFLEEGLNEVFRDISPITDYTGNLSLEFVSFVSVS